MKLADLQNGMEVRYRAGRSNRRNVEWSEWQDGRLYVVRRDGEEDYLQIEGMKADRPPVDREAEMQAMLDSIGGTMRGLGVDQVDIGGLVIDTRRDDE